MARFPGSVANASAWSPNFWVATWGATIQRYRASPSPVQAAENAGQGTSSTARRHVALEWHARGLGFESP